MIQIKAGLVAALSLLAAPLAAEQPIKRPLSAIEWLDQSPDSPLLTPPPRSITEQPAVGHVSIPDVEVSSLATANSDAVGLLPNSVTGLPASLWAASDVQRLSELWHSARQQPSPAVAALYHTLLLAEAERPQGPVDAYLNLRVEMLRRLGAVEPALALLARAGPNRPALFPGWFDLALLEGAVTEACTALAETPNLLKNDAAQIYCATLTGDWRTAMLLYDTGAALGEFSDTETALLELFLDPELAEDAPVPAADITPSPLEFRLFEAIGAPLPTYGLPLAYAMADLRGTMGWKAELEAAERLTRAGALAPERLLGLYTQRRPAASGGVWTRVEAVQKLDAALEAKDASASAAALQEAWQQMRGEGLGVAFAQLFGPRLSGAALPADAQALAYRIRLLTPEYELAAEAATNAPGDAFLAGLAQGQPDGALATRPLERILATAFATPPVAAPEHAELIKLGKLGEAILTAALQFDGADDDPGQMASALGTLRAVGLEDTARRAALQALILEPEA